MINDKIRFAAKVISDFCKYPDHDAIKHGLSGPDPEDYLRAVFLAAVQRDWVRGLATRWMEKIHELLQSGIASDLQDAQLMMEVLEDKDIFPLVKRQEEFDHIFMDRFFGALADEREFTCMERVWRPAYDQEQSQKLWSTALSDGEATELQVQRLAERCGAEHVELDFTMGVQSAAALRIFAANLSQEALSQHLKKSLEAVASQSYFRGEEMFVMLSVLGLEWFRRTGAPPEGLRESMKAFVDKGLDLRNVGLRALPELVAAAKSCDLVNESKFVELVASAGVQRMPADQLRELLDAGLPVSVPQVKDRDWRGSYVHLLSGASDEQVELIARRMTQEQRLDFMRYQLPHMVTRQAHEWSNGVSCIEGNMLVRLHQLGFDLACEFPAYKNEGTAPLHHFAADDDFSSGSRAYPRQFVFTALQALGVRPAGEAENGLQALHLAAIQDDAQAIRALVALGHDVDAKAAYSWRFRGSDKDLIGDTPLVLAVRHGSERALAALVEAGADVGVKAGTGATVMQLAKTESIKRIIRAARTGSSVEKAMAGGQGPKRNLATRADPGIL